MSRRAPCWRASSRRPAITHVRASSTPASCRRTRTIPACGSSSPMSSCVRVNTRRPARSCRRYSTPTRPTNRRPCRWRASRSRGATSRRWSGGVARRSRTTRSRRPRSARSRCRCWRFASTTKPCGPRRQRRPLRPGETAPLVVLGAAQAAKGDLEASTATFRKVVDMEPDTIGHRLNLARALKLQHKLPEALQVIDEGLQREPRNVTALGVATMLSLEGGNVERAAGYSARLSKVAPDAPATLRVEGRVAMAQKRYTDAVAYYDKAVAKGPDSSLIIERYRAARLAGLANAEQAARTVAREASGRHHRARRARRATGRQRADRGSGQAVRNGAAASAELAWLRSTISR